MARRAHYLNPVEFGLMGALLGGLKYKLDLDTERRLEEAEARKEQRLAEIQQQAQIAQEGRANAEWDRRQPIELQNDLMKTEYAGDIAAGHQQSAQQFQATENAKNRAHELTLEGVRNADETNRQLTVAEQEAKLHRANTAYDETFRSMVNPPGGNDGMYGSDGKWYPKGSTMPAGVHPTVGFGATNLGLRGGAGAAGYVSPRTGGVPSPATSGPATGGYPEGTRLRGADGRIYVVQGGVPVPL